jgi:hypothetical protein
MKKPKITKKWSTVLVTLNSVNIEADYNHETKRYYLCHGSNDRSVSFKTEDGGSIQDHIDRAMCVITALEHIRKELL